MNEWPSLEGEKKRKLMLRDPLVSLWRDCPADAVLLLSFWWVRWVW